MNDGDTYEEMAKHLKIMNRRMVLLNPRFASGAGANRNISPLMENK